MDNKLIFHQLYEAQSSTYTYLLADKSTKEAVLIDPVIETIDRDLGLISELGLKLVYVLDTHVHADHITAAGEIRKRTGAKTGLSKNSNVDCADLMLSESDIIKFGQHSLKVLETFGHTDNAVCFLLNNMLFTGDTLLIRSCGRTDFQSGSAEQLYENITKKLFTLPDDTVIYPGHDYKGFTKSTIKDEMLHNPRLNNKTKQQFVDIMNNLNLSYPKQIDKALPANMSCGILSSSQQQSTFENVPILSASEARQFITSEKQTVFIDVRRPDEFNAELGHIEGANLVTLGNDLDNYLITGNRNQKIIFICRSGKRSEEATRIAMSFGYKNVFNLVGGMINWNDQKFEVVRSTEVVK